MNKVFCKGTEHCLKCGVRLLNGPARLCVTCACGAFGITLPKVAVELRMRSRHKFSFAGLADLARRYPTTESLSLIYTNTIKAREYWQQRLKPGAPQSLKPLSTHRTGFEQTVNKDQQPAKVNTWTELRTEILQTFTGCCTYCARPLKREEAEFDTVLSIHMEHSTGHKANYWRLQQAINNLAVCCAGCNAQKGAYERQALLTLRIIMNGRLLFASVPTPELMLAYANHDPVLLIEPDGKNSAPETFVEATAGASLAALGMAMECAHNDRPMAITYFGIRRMLHLGCNDCIKNKQKCLLEWNLTPDEKSSQKIARRKKAAVAVSSTSSDCMPHENPIKSEL